MAGASASEAGQTAASPAGRAEEEARREKVQNLPAALYVHILLSRPQIEYGDAWSTKYLQSL